MGNDFDLEEFPQLFTSPDLRVIELEGDYYIEGESLEAFEEIGDVQEAAVRLLLILNGVAKLQIGDFRQIKMGAIIENRRDGSNQGTVSSTIDAVINHSRISDSRMIGHTPEDAPSSGSRETDKWAALAMRDENALEGSPHLVHSTAQLGQPLEYPRRHGPSTNSRQRLGDQE